MFKRFLKVLKHKQVIFLSAMRSVFASSIYPEPEQAQYYFLSGFTAKWLVRKRGFTEPLRHFNLVSVLLYCHCTQLNMQPND
jgi:ATP-dependent phosphoenolpyruvate carboxykinase